MISVDDKTIEILKMACDSKKEYFTRGHNTLKKSQLVFSNLSNELLQPRITRKYQLRLEKKYGMRRITTHSLRHTHCSLLFEAGASIKEVQERLGHSGIQTTLNIYAHVSKEKKEQTADIFAKYVGI
ncbi:tyrosine-type recombinase/integrase [Candidatus Vagococcus giribetii]|uniref:tyrosine-type recombinase/integrase n=1 Tax=Candidatus Vagococcus giribetii TaxID=2230876 RepID=UPI00351C49E5